MQIVIIGSGNVASVLAKLITLNNHQLLMIVGRNEQAVKSLAQKYNAPYSLSFNNIDQHADIYLLAVSDHAVEEVIGKIKIPKDKLVVHTTGSLSKNILQKTSFQYGVLYPLQSIRKEIEQLPQIPFFIDGNNQDAKNKIEAFAQTLSPLVSGANDEQRIKLHIAAVFVSNFNNFLLPVAEDFCSKENIEFQYLLPLMKETVMRLNDQSPKNVMTGPAIRKDTNTIEKHLQILEKYPDIKNLYRLLTEKIQQNFV